MQKRRCYFIGNTHIDHTWIWNWPEGFDEVHASFQSALDRMEEFPEFVFTCSTTLHYRWVEENDPALFARIKQRVAEGRWQLAGGWVVQSDDNIPSGESFVRQGLYGQLYFQSRFGQRARVGYCVDSFGHHGQLPQILRGQGMIGWLHFRPSWEELELPRSPYRWRGVDGTEIVACRPPGWYCSPDDEWFKKTVESLPQFFENYPETLIFFGVGDHGGGPTIRDLERIREFRSEAPDLEHVSGGLDEFYERAAAAGAALPLVETDLQYSFRGCYTSNSLLKMLNRQAEGRLLVAEKMNSLAAMLCDALYPKAELDRAWDQVLINHFHDIICGTCAQNSTDEAVLRYGGALETADRVRHPAVKRLSARFDRRPPQPFSESLAVCLANSLSWDRHEPASFYRTLPFRSSGTAALVDSAGRPVDFQRIEPKFGTPSWPKAMLFAAKVPAGGATLYHLVDECGGAPPPNCSPIESDLQITESRIESRAWRIDVDLQTGTITSLFDKRHGVELVRAGRRDDRSSSAGGGPPADPRPAHSPGSGAADLRVMRDLGDTWGSGWSCFDNPVGRFTPTRVRIVESGPLRARLEIESEYGRSTARQSISLYRDFDWIEFDLEVNWNDKLKTIKIAFPLAMTGACSFYEIPYGAIERPTNGEEQPVQRWLRVEGSAADGGKATGYTVGFVADSIGGADVLGEEGSGTEVRLTLLRSPFYGYLTSGIGGLGQWEVAEDADRPVTDQGVRRVSYRLLGGPMGTDLGLPEQAEAVSQPLQIAFEGSQPGPLTGAISCFRCDPVTVHLAALKQAEVGNGFVARLVETRGRQTAATVTGPDGYPGIRTTLHPFEIQTWRWTRDRVPVRCNLLEEAI